MSATANLFVETPNVQDLSMTRLSTDSKGWPEEIIQKFKERIPESAGITMTVKYTKIDDENGTATGGIMLSSSSKTAVVPFIVREGQMHPLDVMIAEGRELPLTPDFFAAIFSQQGAFDKIEEFPVTFGGGIQGFAGSDPSITNTTYPPSMTRYASQAKTAAASGDYAASYFVQASEKLAGWPSMLDDILPTVSREQLQEFHAMVEKNSAYIPGYSKSGTMPLLQKIAKYESPLWKDDKKSDEKSFEAVKKPFIMLRTKAPGKYEILANEYGEFSPAIRPVSRREMQSFVSEMCEEGDEAMRELDLSGEKVMAAGGHISGLPGYGNPKEQDKRTVEANEFGTYAVRLKNGNYSKGFVVPKVIDFDQKKVPYKVFLGKDVFSIQGEIVGMRMGLKAFTPNYIDPGVGDTGVFIYLGETDGICTTPVVVKRLVRDPDDFIYMHCHDHDGKPLTLKLNPHMHLERIAKAVGEDRTYLIPQKMKWVRLGEFTEVSSKKEMFHIKQASANFNDLKATLISQGYGTYAIRGLDGYVKKAGWDPTMLYSTQAKFILGSFGLPIDAVDQHLKMASSHGLLDLYLPKLPMGGASEEKTASRQEKLDKIAKLLRRDLFKEAALVESAQTVDSLLALNFVNPDNIAKMISKIPQLKSTISACASLLLASRLGMMEIPEQSTSTAMMRLLEVTDGLEKLRASQQTQAAT